MSKRKESGENLGKSKRNKSLGLDSKTRNPFKIRRIELGNSFQKIIETLVNDYPEMPKKGRS